MEKFGASKAEIRVGKMSIKHSTNMDGEVAVLQRRIAELEEELRQARQENEFIKHSLEHVPVGFEIYDQDGLAAWLNKAMVDFAGLPSAEIAIGKFNVLTDPFSVATGIDKWYHRAYSGELVETEEFTIDMEIAKDDWDTRSKQIRFKMILVPNVLDDGSVSSVFAIMFESTQHQVVKHLNEDLLHSTTRLSAAEETIRNLLGEIDIFAVRIWEKNHDEDFRVLAGHQLKDKTRQQWDKTPSTPPSIVTTLLERAQHKDQSPLTWSQQDPINPEENQAWAASPIYGSDGLLGILEVGSRSHYSGAQLLPTLSERICELLQATWSRSDAQNTFKVLFDSALDSLILIHQSGDVIQFNQRTEQFFGTVPTHLSQMFVDYQPIAALLNNWLPEKSSAPWFELQGLHSNGDSFTAEIGLVKLPNQSEFFVSIRDLTERRALEHKLASTMAKAAKLQETKRLIEGAMMHLPISLLLINDQNEVVFANKATERLLDTLGHNIHESEQVIPGIDIDTLLKRWEDNTTIKDKEKPFEVTAKTQSGEERMLAIRSVPMNMHREIYYVVSVVDFTERIQAERTAAMEETLKERMRALKQSQDLAKTIKEQRDKLARTNELYQAELRSKRMFVANMSHEFRTPITGILGLSDFLLEQDLQPLSREYVNNIRKSADALHIIFEDILDFSQIGLEQTTFVTEKVNLVNLVSNVLELFRQSAQTKNLLMVLNLQHNAPRFIKADPARLRQAMTNLVANAVKFTSQGSVKVNLSASLEGEVCIEIQDTGAGISKDALSRIMLPFEQEDQTYSRKFGGAGLGLTITKNIAEQMGGRLEVESQKGVGSSFRILFPQEPFEESKSKAMEGLRATIIDSETIRSQSLQSMLQWLGASVQTEPSITQWNPAQNTDILFICLTTNAEDEDILSTKAKELKSSCKLVLTYSGMLNESEQRMLSSSMEFITLQYPIRTSSLESLASTKKTIPSLREPVESIENVSKRVLIVDDNPVNQIIASKMLEALNIEFDLADSGTSAIAIADRSKHLLILMDLQMPQMDGYDATKILRQSDSKAHDTYIVAFTAHSSSEERKRALQNGFDSFLTKPLSTQKLKQVIEKAIHHNKTIDNIKTK